MSQGERAPAASYSEPDDHDESGIPPRVVRHRRHQFPARERVVKVRYDDREHAVLAAAAGRAGLTVAGFLAGASFMVYNTHYAIGVTKGEFSASILGMLCCWPIGMIHGWVALMLNPVKSEQ